MRSQNSKTKKNSVAAGSLEVRHAVHSAIHSRPAGFAALLTTAALGLGIASVADAGPQGGTVTSGQGSISTPNASTTVIQQSSNVLGVDWKSFNVGAQERVQFNQPSSNSVAVNRILDQSPSQIFGRVDANGRVVLLNPNGIVFGRTAQLNVGSLVASSLKLANFDPASGRMSFDSNATPGAVVNSGTINATAGSVALLGGRVTNDGLIVANYGSVALGAGKAATLDFTGDGLLQLQVTGSADANPDGAASAVSNSGAITANGGTVLLTAQAAKDVFTNVVNNDGVVRAGRIENVGGEIRLVGSGGAVVNSGTLDASGVGASSTGGTVQMLGDNVGLFGSGRVDVSGDAGGGTALIGGDFQGRNPNVQNAARTIVGTDASINADARVSGDGGRVVVWSDDYTRFSGTLSARGGAQGGNGGFAEVSGHNNLAFGGNANLSASAGKSGTLLLDPLDITIANGGQANLVGTPDDGKANVFAFTEDPAASDTIRPSAITNLLDNGTTVTLQAHNNITVTNTVDGSGSATAGGGLILQAGNNIAVNASLATNDGAIHLSAGDPGATSPSSSATITIASGQTVNAGNASVTLDATGDVNVIGTANGNHVIVNSTNGALALTGTLFAGTGAIDLNIHGAITGAATGTALNGGAVTIHADSVGALATPLRTTVGSIAATSLSNGGVFIRESTGLTNLSVTTDGGAINVTTGNVTPGTATIGTLDSTNGGGGNSANISVDAGTGTIDVGTVTAGAGTVTLNAGSITDTGGHTLSGASASLTATSGDIGTLAKPVLNNVGTLTADTTGSTGGAVFLAERSSASTTLAVTTDGGAINATGTGDLTYSTLDSTNGGGGNSGPITLNTSGDVVLGTTLTAGSGLVTLTGANVTNAADQTITGGIASLTSTSGSVGTSAHPIIADMTGAVGASSANNGIFISAPANITLGAMTASGTANNITINAGGDILDDGTDATTMTRLTGNTVTLISGGNIGASGVGNIDTAATQLTITANNDATIGELDDVALAGNSLVPGTLTLNVGGVFSLAGGATISGTNAAYSAFAIGGAITNLFGGTAGTPFALSSLGSTFNSINIQSGGYLNAAVSPTGALDLPITLSGNNRVLLRPATGTNLDTTGWTSVGNHISGTLSTSQIVLSAANTSGTAGTLTVDPAGLDFFSSSPLALGLRGADITGPAAQHSLSFTNLSGLGTLAFFTGATSGTTTLATDTSNLMASTGGANLTVNESSGLQLGSTVSGGPIGINTGSGAFTATTTNGSITQATGTSVASGLLDLTANGGGSGVGSSGTPILATASSFHGTATSGVFLQDTLNGVLTVTGATGGSTGVGITNTAGGVDITGAVSATGGTVTLGANGAITTSAGSIAGTTLSATGTSIGTSAVSRLTAAVQTLNATATSGNVFVGNTGAVNLADVSGGTIDINASGAINDDTVSSARVVGTSLTLSGTSIGATHAIESTVGTLKATSSGGAIAVNNSGALTLNGIAAQGGAADATINATGAITDVAATTVAANNLTLTGTSIGTSANRIDTAVTGFTATASTGGVYVHEQDGITLTNVAANSNDANAIVDVLNDASDITVGTVSAPGTSSRVTLNSPGNILKGTGAGITAGTVDLTGAAVGALGNALNTTADTITGVAGSVFAIQESNGATLSSITLNGGASTLDIRTTNGDLTVGTIQHNSAVSDTFLRADNGSILAASGSSSLGGPNDNVLHLNAGSNIGTTAAPLNINTHHVIAQVTSNTGQIGLNLTGGSAPVVQAGDLAVGSGGASGGEVFLSSSGNLDTSAFQAGAIGIGSAAHLTLSAPSGTLTLPAAGLSTLTSATPSQLLVRGADVLQGAGHTFDLSASNMLTFQALAPTPGTTFVLNTNSGTLNADVTSGSDLQVQQTADLRLGSITGRDVSITGAGSLLDDGDPSGLTAIHARNLSLAANGGAIGGTATAADAIDVDLGDNNADGSTGILTAAAAGSITVAGTTNNAIRAELRASDGSPASGNGDATLTNGGDITVWAALAPADKVTLTSTGGSIRNYADTSDVRISASNAVLSAAGAIGQLGGTGGGPIRTSTDNLTATAPGGVYISETDGIVLNNINAGTGSALIFAGGSITSAGGTTPVVTAGPVSLFATGAGASVGTAGAPLLVSASSLSAAASQGVFVGSSGTLATAQVNGDLDGDHVGRVVLTNTGSMNVASANGETVTLQTTDSNSDLTVGGAVTSNGAVTLSAGRKIVAGAGNSVTGTQLNASAGGAIGTLAAALNTAVGTMNATAGSGLYAANTGSLTLTGAAGTGLLDVTTSGALTVSAATGTGVTLGSSSGGLTINGAVNGTAGGAVNLSAGTGALSTGTSGSISGASLTASGSTIGSSGARLATAVNTLDATSTGGLFIGNTGGLTITNAKGGSGNADIQTSNGSITAQSVTGAGVTLNAQGSGSNLTLGTITSTADAALSATGNIVGAANNRVAANNLALSAVTIGAANAAINTTVNTLAATATNGVFISESDGLTVTSAHGGSGTVDIGAGGALTVTAADGAALKLHTSDALSLGAINSNGGTINLTAGTSVTDGASGTSVTGGALTVTAGSVGTSSNRLDTAVTSLNGTTSAGGLFVSNSGPLTLTANATGGPIDVKNSSGTITVTTASGAGITLASAGALSSGALNGGTGAVNLTTAANGGMSLSTVSGGSVTANSAAGLTASGAVTSGGAVNLTSTGAMGLASVSGGTVTATGAGLTASGAITSSGAVNLTSTGGGAMTLASVQGTGATLNSGGALTFASIDVGSGSATLTATGAILDGTTSTSSIKGGTLTITGASIGSTTNVLNTAVSNLTATANSGGIFIQDLDDLQVTSATANAGTLQLFAGSGTSAGTLTVGNLSARDNVLLVASNNILQTVGASAISAPIAELRAGFMPARSGDTTGQVGTLNSPVRFGASLTKLDLYLPVASALDPTTAAIKPQVDGPPTVTPVVHTFVGTGAAIGNLLTQTGVGTINDAQLLGGGVGNVRFSGALNSDVFGKSGTGDAQILYVDWTAYDPSVSLFGTLTPALKLPADQREDEETGWVLPSGYTVVRTAQGDWRVVPVFRRRIAQLDTMNLLR